MQRQAERRVAQLRAFVGPQLLLDVLRVHVCTADHKPRPPRRASAAAAAPAPSHAADDAVIARPVSPKKKGGGDDGASGGGGGGREGAAATAAAAAVAVEPLERCIGACMRMLHAMLRSELSAPDGSAAAAGSSSLAEAVAGGGGGGGDGVTSAGGGHGGSGGGGGIDASDRAKYLRMSFLEEDFGDAFGLDGSGWRDGVLREAGVDGAVEDAGSAATRQLMATGIDAAVICLQECQSPDLQRGVLGVLLGLREDGPTKDFLRRELLR